MRPDFDIFYYSKITNIEGFKKLSSLKPLVRDPDINGKLRYMEDAEFYRINHGEISMTGSKLSEPEGSLRPYRDIQVRLTFGAPFFYKASVDELVSQMPQEDRVRCVGIEPLLRTAEVLTDDIRAITITAKLYERV